MKNNCHLNSLSSNHPGQGRSRILSTLAVKASRLGFRALLPLFVIASLQTLFVTDARAQAQLNPLTVRAVENADGSATFSLSGTSSLESSGFFYHTNYSPSLPPLEIPSFFFPLPSGLALTTAGNQSAPMYSVGSQGPSWALFGQFLYPEFNSTISGSGSVRVENFPFFVLTPGTFRVEAAVINSEGESPEESVISGVGYSPFVTVYEVIPLERDPSLTGSAPGTLSSKSGAAVSGTIKITNNGNTPLENLVLSEDSRDFKLGKPLRTSLAPGESTTCKVTFASRKSSASTKVLITAATPVRIYEKPADDAEVEADVEEAEAPSAFTIPGEIVRASVTVKGINASEAGAGARAPRNPIRLLQSKSDR